MLRLQPIMEEQQKLAVWSLVDAFNNTQIRPIRTQQVSYIREFPSFIRSKYSIVLYRNELKVNPVELKNKYALQCWHLPIYATSSAECR